VSFTPSGMAVLVLTVLLDSTLCRRQLSNQSRDLSLEFIGRKWLDDVVVASGVNQFWISSDSDIAVAARIGMSLVSGFCAQHSGGLRAIHLWHHRVLQD
jgi:hypothetical protein